MTFHAAKDLVYTINGNNISSGGYRISKILNGKSKKKGKHTQKLEGGGGSSIFNEDTGIPVGLLLLQRLNKYDYESSNKNSDLYCDGEINKEDATESIVNSDPNKKLVYASVITESDGDDNNGGENIELVIMPSASSASASASAFKNEYLENPIEISSNEIDDELYDSLVKNVSELKSRPNSIVIQEIVPLVPLQRINATKKQHFGKHIEKVFQRRKTRNKRHN
jgi:hypothetical protein